jgi:RHS repeat-associated protein
MLGVGWSLAGLSSIERCNATVGQDGVAAAIALTASDKFCMDGNRLRVTSGTYGQAGSVYQTEIANFSLVTASGTTGTGPTYFTVKAKNGWILEYGNTTDSRVIPGSSTSVLRWMLNKIVDRDGNAIVLTYNTATGYAVPATISWARTSAGASTYIYSAAFAYSTKTAADTIKNVVAGQSIQNAQRLDSVTVSSVASGTSKVVRKYVLTYETGASTSYSRLIQVKECADSAATICLSPTTVTYQGGASGVSTPTTVSVGGTPKYDFNGDGLPDSSYYSSGQWYVAFASTNGTYSAPVATGVTVNSPLFGPVFADVFGTGACGLFARVGTTWKYYWWNGSAFVSADSGVTQAGVTLSDSDGDKRPDIVYMDAAYHVIRRSNTSASGVLSFGTAATVYTVTGTGMNGASLWQPVYLPGRAPASTDYNGDGRDDLLVHRLYTNGLADTIIVYATGSGYAQGAVFADGYEPSRALFINDDKCADFYTANGFKLSNCDASTYTNIPLNGIVPVGIVDWNSDGRSDILVNNAGTLGVYLSTGSGFGSLIPTTLSSSLTGVVDVNGDHQDDLVSYSGGTLTKAVHASSNAPPDLAISFADGFGVTYAPSYTSTNLGAYTKGTGTTYPLADAEGIVVVQAVSITDGIGGTYSKTYTYSAGRTNGPIAKSVGFQQQTETDTRNGIVTKGYFQQDFPYIGMLYQRDVFQSGGTQISHVLVTNAYKTLNSVAYNQRYFPYVSHVVTSLNEVGGTRDGLSSLGATRDLVWDDWGNILTDTTVRTDTDASSPYTGETWTTAITNTITPDTTAVNWCLGVPSRVQSVMSSSSAATVTRTTDLTPDYGKCRATQFIVEPLSATYRVTVARGFDAFGNTSSETVTGINMAARTTSWNWGVRGLSPESAQNALTQSTTLEYDYDKGVRTRATDANGVWTSWEYDEFGRVTKQTQMNGTATRWDYAGCGSACVSAQHKLTVTQTALNSDASVLRDDISYSDQYGRPLVLRTKLLDGTYQWSEARYDSLGRQSQTSVPCATASATVSCVSYWVTAVFDAANRVKEVDRRASEGDGTILNTLIAYAGRTMTTTDPQGKTSSQVIDVNGRLRRTTDANGYYVSMAYDAAGSATSVTDSLANSLMTATYDYGLAAFQRTNVDMDRGGWSFTYNALGDVTSWQDAKTQVFSQTYDALSRPLVRTEPGNTTTWTWGATAGSYNIGKLQSIASTEAGAYSEAYTYDSYGRLITTSIAIPSDGSYSYDVGYNGTTGLVDNLTYPITTSAYRLKLKYAYQNGLLKSVADFAVPTTVFWQAGATTPRGQVSQETLGNGVITSRTFDAVTGGLLSIQSGVGGGTALQNLSYLYDWVGNVTQRQNNNSPGLTENFCYDNVYRLDHSTLAASNPCTSTANLQLTYDNKGNIQSKTYTPENMTGQTWTYDAAKKHAVLSAGPESFTYDNNGNAMTRNGSAVTWTSYNYPSQIAGASESVTFAYGPNRMRWRMAYTNAGVTETTYYIGGGLEKVLNGGSYEFRHYIFGAAGMVAVYTRKSSGSIATTYVLRDHQDSIESLVSSAGSAIAQESFTAFGSRRNATTWTGAPPDRAVLDGITRRGYTGQTVIGAMGLNHMNGRVQDSVIGRFMSADLYVPSSIETQAFNRYSYVINNPITLIDPTGFHYDDPDDGHLVIEGCKWGMIQGETADGRVTCTNPANAANCEPPVPGLTHVCLFFEESQFDMAVTWMLGWLDRHAAEERLANSGEGGQAQSQKPFSFKDWLCSKIGSDHPFTASLNILLDFQLPLMPGVGGGTGVGVTSNGQVYVEFTAQGELGEVLNLSVGAQGGVGRLKENLPVRSPSSEAFIGAQGAVGLGPVVAGGWTHSESGGNSFTKDAFVGVGFAGQAALVAGSNTKIAINSPLCGGQ